MIPATLAHDDPHDDPDTCRACDVERRRLASIETVAPNVDPDDVEAWVAERQALIAAVRAGMVDLAEYARSGRTLTGAPAWPANGVDEPRRRLRVVPDSPRARPVPSGDPEAQRRRELGAGRRDTPTKPPW